MLRPALTVSFLGAFAVLAAAQDGDDKAKAAPEKPAEEAAPAPAPAPAPEPPAEPVRGVRYRLELPTHRAFVGVVTSSHVFERRSEQGWVDADKETPGAGVRLYYVLNQEGFVFVPVKDVLSLERVGDLTEREGRDLAKLHGALERRAVEERERLHKERLAREEAAKAAAQPPADKSKTPEAEKPKDDKSRDGAAPAAKTESTADLVARYMALLIKFPPGRWMPDTPKEIDRRRIVMDIFPTDEEKEFLRVFDDWKKAYDTWKAGQPAATASAAESKDAKGPKK